MKRRLWYNTWTEEYSGCGAEKTASVPSRICPRVLFQRAYNYSLHSSELVRGKSSVCSHELIWSI